MNLSLADLKATVARLLARSDGELKLEVERLSATVSGELTALNDQLVAATSEITRLKEDYTKLDSELTATRLAKAELTALNEKLTDACLAGKVLTLPDGSPEDQRTAALAMSSVEKFAAYQGALNAAFAKAALPVGGLPAAPAKDPAASAPKDTMKLSEWQKLTPADRLAAVKAGVRLVD